MHELRPTHAAAGPEQLVRSRVLLKKEQDVDALTQYDAKGGRYPKNWQELGPRYNQ